ncbi:MAG: DUF559 domain-containing protein, partial [Thaumarchaeota archaeon]|nr:DUF559 domain-containing protein [Nitrososphaerota archaeon]
EWKEYLESGERPNDIPSSPDSNYKNNGWINWGDWLGTGSIATKNRVYLSFNEARDFTRSLNLRSQTEWQQYCKSGKDGIPRLNDIPANPKRVYKNDGWKDYPDWLGIQVREWKLFEEAREFARSLNLRNRDEWKQYCKSGKDGIPKPDDIPSTPRSVYLNNDWNGWVDWLGNEDRVKTEETRKKMSEALKGHTVSEETKRKLSEALNRPEVKRKMIEFQREYQNRPEVKEKKSEFMREFSNRSEVKRKFTENQREYQNRPEVKEKKSEFFREFSNRPEVKRKMIEFQREYQNRPEIKEKKSESTKGKKYHLGKTHSEEARRKMSEAGKGEKNPFYGKRHPEEARRKMSKFQTMYQNRPEVKEKSMKVLEENRPENPSKLNFILYKICDDEGIKYKPEKKIKLTQKELHDQDTTRVDLFIEPNICLFADGTYHHADPEKYDDYSVIRLRHKDRLAKDIRKIDDGITRDLESQGYTVLRFWEDDLNRNTEKCRQKIVDAVRKSKESLV